MYDYSYMYLPFYMNLTMFQLLKNIFISSIIILQQLVSYTQESTLQRDNDNTFINTLSFMAWAGCIYFKAIKLLGLYIAIGAPLRTVAS